jgi:hypothetical protein
MITHTAQKDQLDLLLENWWEEAERPAVIIHDGCGYWVKD